MTSNLLPGMLSHWGLSWSRALFGTVAVGAAYVFSEDCGSVSQFNRSVVPDFVTLWTAACQASLSITNS